MESTGTKPKCKYTKSEFIHEKLNELREKHKDKNLLVMDYMDMVNFIDMAIAEWKIYKENKNAVVVA